MTIKELIEQLQNIDSDLHVFTKGYEGGVNDVITTRGIVHVELNCNTEWYYGSHELVGVDHKSDKEIVKGIIL